ncbi:MAG: lantibiotic dehydratase [Clostridiales bacterium]
MKQDNRVLFTTLNFFMIRTPILPLEFFDIICFNDEKTDKFSNDLYGKIMQLSKNKAIREAIAVASLSLLKSIDKINFEKNPKKKEQTVINFVKYLIRMSTRATPFGLFSAVTTGSITEEKSNISLFSANSYKKNIRPDMEWLLSIIKKIEQDVNYVKQLNICTNSLVDYSGERAYLAYSTSYGKENKNDKEQNNMENVSVRFTEAVEFAFDCAKNPINYNSLLNKLFIKYPEEAKKVIEDFVWQLFETEFFISELRPPLMIKSPFEYVLNKMSFIKGLEEEVYKLRDIKTLIKKYEDTTFGYGTDVYLHITNKMKDIYVKNKYLQVDFIAKKSECKINKNIAKEIEKIAQCLWRLSPEFTSTPEFSSYRNDFIEKYGVYRDISLLELLDIDRGLGPPAGYRYPEGSKTLDANIPIALTNMERFIQSEIIKNKIEGNITEIELTDEIIEKIEPIKPDYSKAPISMELYFSIYSDSQINSESDNFELILSPNPGSYGAGKTFGRFFHYLDNESREKIKSINNIEKTYYEDTIFAELVFMPDSGRSANICILDNYRDYEIVLSTNSSKSSKQTLPLSDLLIGTNYNQFYIKSKSLGKRVIVTTGHMLNLNRAPNIYRFLREVSSDGLRNWFPLMKGSVDNLPFVPRIRYKKTILSPAMWNFSWESINEKDDKIKNNIKMFIEKIKNWRNKWNVTRYVYLTEMDNRILLDLESNVHLKLLLSETSKLNSYSALSLVEAKIDKSISINKRKYFAEIVVPLIKNKKFVKNNTITQENNELGIKNRILLNKTSKFSDSIRIKYPGSDWLFIKFYGNKNREEEFIAFRLKEICKEIVENNYVEKYFFMRYVDPEPHIRLRFNGNPQMLYATLLPKLYEYSISLKNEGLLSRLVLDTYEREVERYGGPEIIDFAEDIFYIDSEIVHELIYLKRNGELKFDFEKLIIISIIYYLEQFQLDFDSQLEFLDSIIDRKQYLDDFRKDRKTYIKISNSNNDWEGLKTFSEGNLIKEILSRRSKKVSRFIQKLNLLEFNERLFNSKRDILASIIHLHCNRIIGIDRIYERKIMTITRHCLYNLKFSKTKKVIEKKEQTKITNITNVTNINLKNKVISMSLKNKIINLSLKNKITDLYIKNKITDLDIKNKIANLDIKNKIANLDMKNKIVDLKKKFK